MPGAIGTAPSIRKLTHRFFSIEIWLNVSLVDFKFLSHPGNTPKQSLDLVQTKRDASARPTRSQIELFFMSMMNEISADTLHPSAASSQRCLEDACNDW